MHLVGFIIRIYHDARSPERQMQYLSLLLLLLLLLLFIYLFIYLFAHYESVCRRGTIG